VGTPHSIIQINNQEEPLWRKSQLIYLLMMDVFDTYRSSTWWLFWYELERTRMVFKIPLWTFFDSKYKWWAKSSPKKKGCFMDVVSNDKRVFFFFFMIASTWYLPTSYWVLDIQEKGDLHTYAHNTLLIYIYIYILHKLYVHGPIHIIQATRMWECQPYCYIVIAQWFMFGKMFKVLTHMGYYSHRTHCISYRYDQTCIFYRHWMVWPTIFIMVAKCWNFICWWMFIFWTRVGDPLCI